MRLHNTAILLLCVADLSIGIGGASAESVYRYTDEEGKTIYTDSPPSESADVKQVPVPPPPNEKDVQKAKQRHQKMLRDLAVEKQRKTGAQRGREQRINTQISFREQLTKELETARGKLERAEKALKEGETPRPGERIGTVYGTSRLRPEYFERIKGLQQRVDIARTKVEQAEHNLRTMSRGNKKK